MFCSFLYNFSATGFEFYRELDFKNAELGLLLIDWEWEGEKVKSQNL